MGSGKTLYIVRHGKSSWDHPGVSDFDRPLKEKGIRNAYEIAETLNVKKAGPEVIYTSPAARALNTAVIFSRVLNFPDNKIYVRKDLYLADAEEILEIIKETSPEVNSVMVFGHNPGFTELVNHLSDLRLPNLPTSGMVCLQFSSKSWVDIEKGNLSSSYCEFPGDS